MSVAMDNTDASTWTVQPMSLNDASVPPVMTYGLIIDGLLDHNKLRAAFETLVKRWPILGSRIGRDDKGAFVYLVPKSTEGLDLLTYDETSYSTPLSDHFHLPRATTYISCHPCKVDNIFKPSSQFKRPFLADYADVTPLLPLFHLQLSRFSDGKTALGLTAAHAVGDAVSFKEVFIAWLVILKYGDAAVLKDLDDVLSMDKIAEGVKLDRKPKRRWSLAGEDLPPATEMLAPASKGEAKSETDASDEDKGEMRWLFVPKSVLAKMRQESNDVLKSSGRWVSEGDMLVAWCAKAAYPPRSDKRETRVGLLFPMDIRERLPELTSPKVLLSNANHFSPVIYSSRTALASRSLTDIASDVRSAIQDSTPEEVRLSLGHRGQAYRGEAPPSSQSPIEIMGISNWTKMGWGGDWLDFSPALEEGSGKVIWVDINVVGEYTPPLMIAPRRDEDGLWVWFTVASWVWTTGILAEVPFCA